MLIYHILSLVSQKQNTEPHQQFFSRRNEYHGSYGSNLVLISMDMSLCLLNFFLSFERKTAKDLNKGQGTLDGFGYVFGWNNSRGIHLFLHLEDHKVLLHHHFWWENINLIIVNLKFKATQINVQNICSLPKIILMTLLYNLSLSTMQSTNFVCWTPGCGKKAAMMCPTCKQMDLQACYFCSQQCFKKTWAVHKLIHIPREQTQKKRNEGFKFTGPLRPGVISKRRQVPEHIQKPDYYFTSIPKKQQESKLQNIIEVKSQQEIAKLREVAILARKALDLGHSVVKAGVTTDYIDEVVHNFIIENNAYPSPLNYYKFPKSLCTSVNEVICHGIPDNRPLQNGDIVNLDVTVYKDGVHVDLNQTYLVGEVAQSSKFLVTKAYECLQKAIQICKPGTMYREIGNVISKFIQQNGLSVNRTYCGHGLGTLFHCAPNVPHYGNNKATGFMKPGHVFTIEPMINAGVHKDITWPDNWTAVTADGQRSAQFQHTLLITEGGCQVLTKRLQSSPKLQFL